MLIKEPDIHQTITERLNNTITIHMMQHYLKTREFVRIDLVANYLKQRGDISNGSSN